jgi:hypothetical protein
MIYYHERRVQIVAIHESRELALIDGDPDKPALVEVEFLFPNGEPTGERTQLVADTELTATEPDELEFELYVAEGLLPARPPVPDDIDAPWMQ